MSEKILGYVLLAVGLLIILFAALRVYVVFTTSAQPLPILDPNLNLGMNISLPDGTGQKTSLPLQIGELGPVVTLLNKIIYLLLMGFMASIGYKIALLGVNLLRPVVVKSKESPVKSRLPVN